MGSIERLGPELVPTVLTALPTQCFATCYMHTVNILQEFSGEKMALHSHGSTFLTICLVVPQEAVSAGLIRSKEAQADTTG